MANRQLFNDYVAPFIPFVIAAAFIFLEPGERLVESVAVQRDGLDKETLRPAEQCSNPAGDAALRALLIRLSPDLGRRVRIDVYNKGPFLVTAAGKDRIIVTQAALTMTSQPELAALLAHELAHLHEQNAAFAELGDARSEEAVLEVPTWRSRGFYSAEEEELADQDAMDMMLEAQIPIYPAVRLYGDAAAYDKGGRHYAHEQFALHSGLPNRAELWSPAASSDYSARTTAINFKQEQLLKSYCGAPVYVESSYRVAQPAG